MPRLILTEAKNIGDHAATKTPWKHHGVMGSIAAVLGRGRHQVLHDVGQRVVYARFARLEAQFRRDLSGLFAGIRSSGAYSGYANDPKTGKVIKDPKTRHPVLQQKTRPSMEPSNRKMKALFRAAYTEAFKLGKLSAQGGYRGMVRVDLDAEDKRWLETFLRKEFDYWKKFMEDIRNKRGKLDYERRLELYVQTLKSMYNSSRIISTPPTTLFHWETTPAEHCPHCLYLQRKSPFTKDNLPAVPASGDTKCRSNCRCHLRMEIASVTKYLRVKKSAPTRQQLLREMRALK